MYGNGFRAILTAGIVLYLASACLPKIGDPGAITTQSVATTRASEDQNCLELAEQGLHRRAKECVFRAVELAKRNGRHREAIDTLAQFVDYYLQVGKYEEVNAYCQNLLRTEGLPSSTRVNAFTSMGILYQRLQHFALAISYYEKSMELSKRDADHSAQARALVSMASAFVEMNEIGRAEACLGRMRALRVKDPILEADVLWLAGKIDRGRGNIDLARQAFESARIKLDAIDNTNADYVLLLSELSELYLKLGQRDLAHTIAKEAWQRAQKLKIDEVRLRASLALARAQRALGFDQEANASYENVLGRVEKLLIYLSPDSMKISVLEQGQAPYREVVDLLMRTNRESKALHFAERARARATLNLLSKTVKTGPSLEQMETPKRAERNVARIRTLLYSSETAQATSSLEQRLRVAELEREEVRLQTQLGGQKHFVQPVNPEVACKKLLGPNQALISFFLTEDRSYAWFITPDGVRSATLRGQHDIENRVSEYINIIKTQPSSLTINRDVEHQRRLGNELFSLLLGGFTDQFKSRQELIIVPDGLLAYLPFETLINNGRYLVEAHEISYVPSVTVLARLREREKNRQSTNSLDLLAFGAPDLKSLKNNLYHDLSPIPGAANEVRVVSGNFKSDRRRVYTGQEATEEVFRRESLSRFRYIHIATHGIIDNNFPGRSAVVLAIDTDPYEDGFLQFNEIADLDLGCELSVLSACRTGQGQLMRGEGVVGLTRAFLSAGAAATAASLWDVIDLSATDFMDRFYKHLVSGNRPASALRQAKLEFIQGKGAERHPIHWAPFVIIGNTN
jgi:CHAT domain-containing protein